ncbi:hypothetical protein B0H94_11029 [Salsuginibacillus halophilus]|uniref:Uncharacterized protein n=1 Tax=Salsuginibacillus halophilus TaxID=517424 RepID=A0A2P8HBF4_9BACI|nr:hypothetical protein B0H94_11029 [Salsuginibacillus halophilus]
MAMEMIAIVGLSGGLVGVSVIMAYAMLRQSKFD